MAKRKPNKRGRPKNPPGENKAERCEVRLNAAEKQGFSEAADLAGISLSSWMRERLRECCREELKRQGRPSPF